MYRLPTYTVTVWYWDRPETMKYRELLIKATEAFPMDATEYEGVHDMHWGTQSEDEAKAILEKLRPFISDSNVVVIRLSSLREDFNPVIYKDERYIFTGVSKEPMKADT
jgi:hypothetical protein